MDGLSFCKLILMFVGFCVLIRFFVVPKIHEIKTIILVSSILICLFFIGILFFVRLPSCSYNSTIKIVLESLSLGFQPSFLFGMLKSFFFWQLFIFGLIFLFSSHAWEELRKDFNSPEKWSKLRENIILFLFPFLSLWLTVSWLMSFALLVIKLEKCNF